MGDESANVPVIGTSFGRLDTAIIRRDLKLIDIRGGEKRWKRLPIFPPKKFP